MSAYLPALVLGAFMLMSVIVGATLSGMWLALLAAGSAIQARVLWHRYRR